MRMAQCYGGCPLLEKIKMFFRVKFLSSRRISRSIHVVIL